jgi:hypothetical protein
MNSKIFMVTVGILASLATSAGAQTVGDWVLGNYQGGAYWFPGVVESIGNGTVTVRYDDGDVETVGTSAVRPYDWMIGMTVECNFQGSGEWYSGKIASLAGEKIGIAYDDGDKETTKTGRCRSN